MATNQIAKRIPIAFLASYPKSGNTWLRIQLYCYAKLIYKLPDWIDKYNFIPDNLSGTPFAPQEWVVETNENNSPRLFLVKTHFRHKKAPLSQIAGEHPISDRFVYIYRNPLDTFLSYVHYLLTIELPDETLFTAEERLFFRNLFGLDKWQQFPKNLDQLGKNRINEAFERFIDMGLSFSPVKPMTGGYFENLESYFSSGVTDSVIIRYEDMLRNPWQTLSLVIEFLDFPLQKDMVDAAVNMADTFTRPDGKFFHKRRAFYYRDYLNKKSIDRFLNRFANELEYFRVALN